MASLWISLFVIRTQRYFNPCEYILSASCSDLSCGMPKTANFQGEPDFATDDDDTRRRPCGDCSCRSGFGPGHDGRADREQSQAGADPAPGGRQGHPRIDRQGQRARPQSVADVQSPRCDPRRLRQGLAGMPPDRARLTNARGPRSLITTIRPSSRRSRQESVAGSAD